MVINGYFGEQGRPLVNVGVQLPGTLRKIRSVSFLVDTGADRTLLSYEDAHRLRVSYANRGNPVRCSGVGGPVGVFPERAVLIFKGTVGRLLMLELEIGILQRVPDAESIPSLLGRDLLDEFRLVVDRRAEELMPMRISHLP